MSIRLKKGYKQMPVEDFLKYIGEKLEGLKGKGVTVNYWKIQCFDGDDNRAEFEARKEE